MLRSGRGRCSRSYTGHPSVDLASDVGQVDGAKGEVGAGPEPIKPSRWREEETNPVAKHSDIEASLPQTFPHPAPATRRTPNVYLPFTPNLRGIGNRDVGNRPAVRK